LSMSPPGLSSPSNDVGDTVASFNRVFVFANHF
jgi:hypothetical protein